MNKKSDLPVLPQVEIENPCPMKWSELHGDDRKRFCGQCQKHVLNFSAMQASEIRDVMESGVSVCAQIHKRPDGSIVTREEISLRRRWLGRFIGLAASVIGIVTFGGCDEVKLRQWLPFTGPSVEGHQKMGGEVEFMGDIAPAEEVQPRDVMGGVRALGKVGPSQPERAVQ